MYNKFKIGGDDSKKFNKKTIFIIGGVVVIAIIIGILIAVFMPKGEPNTPSGNNGNSTTIEPTTEEQQRVTKETLEKYVSVDISGYYESEDNPVSKDVVGLSIKNISNEILSITIELGAYNTSGELLETSAIYAENVNPGGTQAFEMFAYTNLTADQLKTASYKVYRAWTDKNEIIVTIPEETATEPEPTPEPEEEPTPEPEQTGGSVSEAENPNQEAENNYE